MLTSKTGNIALNIADFQHFSGHFILQKRTGFRGGGGGGVIRSHLKLQKLHKVT